MTRTYTISSEKGSLCLTAYTDRIIRVTYTKAPGTAATGNRESFMVTAQPASDISVTTSSTEELFTCELPAVRAIVDKKSLSVRFERPDGTHLSRAFEQELQEYDLYRTVGGNTEEHQTVDGLRVTVTDADREYLRTAYHGKLTLSFDENEELFGLGSHEEGYHGLKGRYVPLYQENMRIALPYLVSTKGYADLLDCNSYMTFDATERRYGRFWMDCVDTLDLYFIAGDDFDDVCRSYRTLTGITPMLPKWAVGYIQSRERYVSQEHVLETAREYRRIGTPIDCIIQDWCTWPNDLWGYKHFDPTRYPDPSGMMDELHGLNLHLLLSIWANPSGGSPDQTELANAGKLLGDGVTYNAFDPEARAIYWRQANEQLFSHGIDGWWCDASEPFDAVWGGDQRPPMPERMLKSTGEFKKYLDDGIINAYSIHHSRGIYEGQRSVTDEKRVINLTRSGFPGQHRYGTIVWSGDVSATWETLRKQISVAQNYIACGEAYWNADIGAFFVKQWYQWFGDGDYPAGKDDLGYRELYTRWLQFAVFTPFMRSHGTDTPREVWQFGERGTLFRNAIEDAIALRYRLAPYFYSLNAAVTFDGTMPITPLALAYPHDRTARTIERQYLYGHELLVCPVTHPMYYTAGSVEVKHPDRFMDIYLPDGGWYDFYTEEYFEGGRSVRVACDISRIPVFVRAGAILPVSPVMPYVDADPDAVCEVRIYAGADGRFTLYNDAGDGYAYEQGDYTAVTITYDHATGQVTEKTDGVDNYRRTVHYRIIGR